MASPSDVVVQVDLLANLLKTLENAELAAKLSLPVDPKIVALLKLIVEKLPSSTFITTLNAVLANGSIEVAEIPTLVLLVTQLYNSDLKKLVEVPLDYETIVSFLKFLIHALVDLSLIQVENPTQLYSILDSSLALLSITLEVGVPAVNLKSCC